MSQQGMVNGVRNIALLLIIIIVLVSGCADKEGETIRIVGSTSMQPVSEVLVEGYQEQHPNVKIFIQGGDSELGIRSIKNDIVEIGALSRPLNKEEQEMVKAYEVANDSISIITNKNNKLDTLRLQQLHDIFTGKITNWKEVGGHDSFISVISREQGSGTYNVLKDIVIGENKEILKNVSVMNSTGAVRTSVSIDENAIGYISSNYADESINVIEIIDDGNRSVTLSRPLIYITGEEVDDATKQFLDYALSSEGKEIINQKLYN
ncbi:MAG: phosphate ABC transporter substrate-binding protein [Firmicutes bacterium]|nr:phosphate ABC transporter substrate-binding protein [Bacillota bacterium]